MLPLYTALDPTANIAKVFIVMMMLFQLMILGYRYVSAPYYNRSVQQFVCVLDSSLVWISCTSVVCAIVD